MISRTDYNMRQGHWNRFMGSLLYGKTIGLLGVGRIGKTVANMLKGFNVKLLGHDINVDHAFFKALNIQSVTKEILLENSEIISLHIPLNQDTVNYISMRELSCSRDLDFDKYC